MDFLHYITLHPSQLFRVPNTDDQPYRIKTLNLSVSPPKLGREILHRNARCKHRGHRALAREALLVPAGSGRKRDAQHPDKYVIAARYYLWPTATHRLSFPLSLSYVAYTRATVNIPSISLWTRKHFSGASEVVRPLCAHATVLFLLFFLRYSWGESRAGAVKEDLYDGRSSFLRAGFACCAGSTA